MERRELSDRDFVSDILLRSVVSLAWWNCTMSPLAGKCSLCLFPLQVHVSQSSDVPDHCRVYALNDPTECDYQSQCGHAMILRRP